MSRVAGKGNLEQKAYTEIKNMIFNFELKAGEVIVQDQLAQKIGVSRTPLRRALAELERDYLVETTSLGVVVREFSEDFLKSIWEVRAVLEGLSCRLATSQIDDATIMYLRMLFEEGFKKWEAGDEEPYKKADVTFHRKLTEIAGNPVLKSSLESTHVFNIAFELGLVRLPDETFTEHMAILDAMKEKDSSKAEILMLEHIHNSTSRIKVKQNAFIEE